LSSQNLNGVAAVAIGGAERQQELVVRVGREAPRQVEQDSRRDSRLVIIAAQLGATARGLEDHGWRR
jgi:hypothetical protein